MDADYRVNTLELRDALKLLIKVGKDKNIYTGEAVIDFLVDKIEVNFSGKIRKNEVNNMLANIDKAFDLGYISFNENGRILISEHLEEFQILGIHPNMKIALADQHQDYLAYHREQQFKQ